MIDEALRTLIAFVESASPVVWAAAQQEVIVQTIINIRAMYLFVVLGILFAALGAVSVYKAFQAGPFEGDGWILGAIFGITFGILGFVIAYVSWNQVTALTMNPEYQAIKIISALVKGVGN